MLFIKRVNKGYYRYKISNKWSRCAEMNHTAVNYSKAEGRMYKITPERNIARNASWVFFLLQGQPVVRIYVIYIRCILTNQRRSFLFVAYLKVAARQVSVRCQQVSISMEVGRKDPWKRKWGIKSSFKSLEIESIYRKWSQFQLSIFYFSRIVLRLGFFYSTNVFILAIIFFFFFKDNLTFQ